MGKTHKLHIERPESAGKVEPITFFLWHNTTLSKLHTGTVQLIFMKHLKFHKKPLLLLFLDWVNLTTNLFCFSDKEFSVSQSIRNTVLYITDSFACSLPVKCRTSSHQVTTAQPCSVAGWRSQLLKTDLLMYCDCDRNRKVDLFTLISLQITIGDWATLTAGV